MTYDLMTYALNGSHSQNSASQASLSLTVGVKLCNGQSRVSLYQCLRAVYTSRNGGGAISHFVNGIIFLTTILHPNPTSLLGSWSH